MISLADTADGFPALARQYKKVVTELINQLEMTAESFSPPASDNLFNAGMDKGRIYLIRSGMVSVYCKGRKLYLLDEGDLILPDAAPDAADYLYYSTSAPVLMESFDTLAFVRAALRQENSAKLWTRLSMLQQSLLNRLIASHADEETFTTPGFAYYQPGDVIIHQGESADYVFSLFEGQAEVLVNGVVVGQVGEGEVVGALAVLTKAPRSATVRALTRCSVVKVPQEQFTHLIRSNPTMIHNLMLEMANQIKNLNQQVVKLRQPE